MDLYLIQRKIKNNFKKILPKNLIPLSKKVLHFYYSHKHFNHKIAQRYEYEHTVDYIQKREKFNDVYKTFEKIKSERLESKTAYQYFRFTNFFENEKDFLSFYHDMSNKNCLEIGSGVYGILALLPEIKKRYIMEPLLDKYRQAQLNLFGKTLFFSDVVPYSKKAEILEQDLVNKIDGCIFCRNVLDHCENPWKILENIAQYALPGSKLFLWTDLWHFAGLDEGHINITNNKKEFEDRIKSLGYQIDRVLPDQTDESFLFKTLNYGCVATKI